MPAGTPMARASTAVAAAIGRLTSTRAETISGFDRNSRNHSSVKPLGGNAKVGESPNDTMTTTSRGAISAP
jgi:hypothetical protein